LTSAYREQARLAAELTSTRKELRKAETERSQLADAQRAIQARLAASESSIAAQSERLQQVETDRDRARDALNTLTGQLGESEAARQRLQATVDV
jgi:predicted  nucleic acid-binding Zn-ribbon protein